MATKLKKRVSELSHIGPRRVMCGDLADSGGKGIIYAPTGRAPVPLIVLVKDWMTPVSIYKEMARHLASWGLACVVPAIPSTTTSADILVQEVDKVIDGLFSTSLGNGTAPLDRHRIGVFGHGRGGSVAALLAKRSDRIRGIVSAYPVEVAPNPVETAAHCRVPALIIAPENTSLISVDIAEKLGDVWGKDVIVRQFPGASRLGVAGTSLLEIFGVTEKSERKALKRQTATITGYLLAVVAGDDDEKAFTELDAKISSSEVLLTTRQELEAAEEDEKTSSRSGLFG